MRRASFKTLVSFVTAATVAALAASTGCSAGSGGGGSGVGSGGSSAAGGTGGSGGSTAGTGGTINPTGGTGGTVSLDASGGTGGLGDAACAALTETAENKVQPADIIIAVDQSGSMDDETQWVQSQLNGFSTQITNAGIDVHVVLIAVQPATPSMDINGLGCNVNENPICVPPPLAAPSCGDSASFMNVNCHVDSRDALTKIVGTWDTYSSFLRPDAQRHVIVISDDDSNVPATQFDTDFRALETANESYRFHAIYSFTDDDFLTPCWQVAAREGKVYRQLVQMRGGVEGDLCVQNFQPVWDAVSQQVVTSSTIACEWDIPPTDGGMLDPSLVNVEFVGGGSTTELGYVSSAAECANFQNGWYFDDNVNPTKVFACPDTCMLVQSESAVSISLKFGCARTPAIPK